MLDPDMADMFKVSLDTSLKKVYRMPFEKIRSGSGIQWVQVRDMYDTLLFNMLKYGLIRFRTWKEFRKACSLPEMTAKGCRVSAKNGKATMSYATGQEEKFRITELPQWAFFELIKDSRLFCMLGGNIDEKQLEEFLSGYKQEETCLKEPESLHDLVVGEQNMYYTQAYDGGFALCRINKGSSNLNQKGMDIQEEAVLTGLADGNLYLFEDGKSLFVNISQDKYACLNLSSNELVYSTGTIIDTVGQVFLMQGKKEIDLYKIGHGKLRRIGSFPSEEKVSHENWRQSIPYSVLKDEWFDEIMQNNDLEVENRYLKFCASITLWRMIVDDCYEIPARAGRFCERLEDASIYYPPFPLDIQQIKGRMKMLDRMVYNGRIEFKEENYTRYVWLMYILASQFSLNDDVGSVLAGLYDSEGDILLHQTTASKM